MEVAGLTDLLKQEGSYTIFAPTDEAFDGLTPEDFELLKSEHPAKIHTGFKTWKTVLWPQWPCVIDGRRCERSEGHPAVSLQQWDLH